MPLTSGSRLPAIASVSVAIVLAMAACSSEPAEPGAALQRPEPAPTTLAATPDADAGTPTVEVPEPIPTSTTPPASEPTPAGATDTSTPTPLATPTPRPTATRDPAAAPPAPSPTATPTPPPIRPAAERLRVEVLERLGHDTSAFTQGLEFHAGRLYESRGGYGTSALTEIDLRTGQVLRRTDLTGEFFAEGMTVVDDRIIQITWREQTAFVYDLESFEVIDQYSYIGEGWGLCLDENRLIMSNGTDELTFRDPATFEVEGSVSVTYRGQPIDLLNELECVDGLVWSNVWRTDSLVVIDPSTGEVLAVVDASGLLTPAEAGPADVLNGIAFDPVASEWLITGKDWPAMFRVGFVPCDDC